MATPVVSLPVPDVVGTAISGFTGPGTGKPFPTGALTKSRKSALGNVEYKLAALAVSMAEPPPTARNASNLPALAAAIAACKRKKSI